MTAYERVLELHPPFTFAWRNLASLHVSQWRFAEARRVLLRSAAACSTDAAHLAHVARFLCDPNGDPLQRDVEAALRIARQAATRAPESTAARDALQAAEAAARAHE